MCFLLKPETKLSSLNSNSIKILIVSSNRIFVNGGSISSDATYSVVWKMLELCCISFANSKQFLLVRSFKVELLNTGTNNFAQLPKLICLNSGRFSPNHALLQVVKLQDKCLCTITPLSVTWQNGQMVRAPKCYAKIRKTCKRYSLYIGKGSRAYLWLSRSLYAIFNNFTLSCLLCFILQKIIKHLYFPCY